MAAMKLNSMSASDLIDLREKIDRVLAAKIHLERTALEASLRKLAGHGETKSGRGRTKSALAGKKVAPKYRGPDGETWTGRGLKPRWLMEALKGGKKIEQFLIAKGGSRQKGRSAKG